ncbi:MAG: Ubiqui/menaqui biosynthesis C-methylase UbiE [Actinotalea sp.]|nr:Ubiqui/menaqui biosynthesis C-methylase UbiE [Actinotalea sp.]
MTRDDVDTDTGAVARRYQRKVLDPVSWRLFGSSGYYDVGLWSPGVATQERACEALVDRLAAAAGPGVGRLLDVACGAGATTDRLRRVLGPGVAAVGIDVAPRLVDVARVRSPACEFLVMDAASLGFAETSFDVVSCVEGAFHFRSRRGFLHEAARVLRPGGRLVLSDLVVADTDLLGAWMSPTENAMAPGDYPEMVASAGFEDVVVQDETEACWRAYCRWAGAHADSAALRSYFAALGSRAVQAYLLVTATRSLPAMPAGAQRHQAAEVRVRG